MHKALYRFCDAVNTHLRPMLVNFPTGGAAIRSAREIKKLSGIPNIVGIIDGTHTEI